MKQIYIEDLLDNNIFNLNDINSLERILQVQYIYKQCFKILNTFENLKINNIYKIKYIKLKDEYFNNHYQRSLLGKLSYQASQGKSKKRLPNIIITDNIKKEQHLLILIDNQHIVPNYNYTDYFNLSELFNTLFNIYIRNYINKNYEDRWAKNINISNKIHNNQLTFIKLEFSKKSEQNIFFNKNRFKKIKQFENYAIDNNGVVINMKTNKILKQANNNGYKKVTLQTRNCLIHRLVAETFIGNIPEDYVVNHIDGNKHNNNMNNLEIITKSQNLQHAIDNQLKKIVSTNSVNTPEILGSKWKICKENRNYLISNNGQVFSLFSNKILSPSKREYIYYQLAENKKSKGYRAHRLVANNFIQNIPTGYVVNHIDGNKHNNNINNLEIVTYKQNTQHAHDEGFRNGIKKGQNITLLDKKNNKIKTFSSVSKAEKNIYNKSNGKINHMLMLGKKENLDIIILDHLYLT